MALGLGLAGVVLHVAGRQERRLLPCMRVMSHCTWLDCEKTRRHCSRRAWWRRGRR